LCAFLYQQRERSPCVADLRGERLTNLGVKLVVVRNRPIATALRG